MSQHYKEERICPCGYKTSHRGNWSTHKRRCSLQVVTDHEKEQLREQLAAALDDNKVKSEQLAAKEAQLTDVLTRNAALEQLLSKQLLEVSEELKQTKKRKDRYAEATATRKPRTEPERRKVAQAQGWKCANPDGGCLLLGELQEYDIDHITPVWKGGLDEPENLQALCPACHRRKTNRERVERSAGEHAPGGVRCGLNGPVVEGM